MKKRLTLLSLLLLFTMTAMALTKVSVGGIYYYLDESDNTAEVTLKTDGTKYSGDIVIPASISVDGVDYSVTSIADHAFLNCSGLTSIEIPNSVTYIGYAAFYYCPGLTSIVVEEGNSYYDSRENCNAIIETASNKLIAGCQNTVIPNSVTEIGDDAFSECSSLTSIEIPNSVTSIGDCAFYGCYCLTSIVISNSVKRIGYSAFAYCFGLTSITMQRATPPIVGSYLFDECSKLETIYVPVGASEAYNKYPWNKYNIVEREVAGIESVTLEEWPADVYDLNGRMVKAQAESLDELPKGVYIVNGKKFVK